MPHACSAEAEAQSFLELEHAKQIQRWYEQFADVPDAVRIVDLDSSSSSP